MQFTKHAKLAVLTCALFFVFYFIVGKRNTSDLLACPHWTVMVFQAAHNGRWGPTSTSDKAKAMFVSEHGKRWGATAMPRWMRTVCTRR